MIVSTHTLDAWRPDDLTTHAKALISVADEWDELSDTARALLADLDATVWSGMAAERGHASSSHLIAGQRDAGEAVRHAARVIDRLAGSVRQAQLRLSHARELAWQHGLTISDRGQARSIDSPDGTDYGIVGHVEALTDEALRTAAQADRNAAAALWEAELVPQLVVGTAAGLYSFLADALPREVFGSLLQSLEPFGRRLVPGPGTDPRDVLQWWESMSPRTQAMTLGAFPHLLAGLDGLPQSVLDDAALAAYRRKLLPPSTDAGELRALLDRARARDLNPTRYAPALQQYYVVRAAEKAGIDLRSWLPEKGTQWNRETIEAVYEYYGRLYLDQPYMQWAGMANMIGPSFAAGFHDLDMFRDFAEEAARALEPTSFRAEHQLFAALAAMTDSDLAFYESTFLTMQQDIFFDQASMHEAYLDGGLDAIREFEQAELISPRTLHAWRDIEAGRHGSAERLSAGNTMLLLREQDAIIQHHYTEMFEHAPSGPALTYALTLVGEPSIPGARTYAEVFPYTARIETPGYPEIGIPFTGIGYDNPLQGSVIIEMPLPDGNLAHLHDRWELIMDDTLPAYLNVITETPDLAREIIATPVADRIAEQRLEERLDEILIRLADWNVRLEQ